MYCAPFAMTSQGKGSGSVTTISLEASGRIVFFFLGPSWLLKRSVKKCGGSQFILQLDTDCTGTLDWPEFKQLARKSEETKGAEGQLLKHASEAEKELQVSVSFSHLN
jgi:hypothetical protein